MTDLIYFQIEAHTSGSRARTAIFQTVHNVVQMLLFRPVGTQATVKAQSPQPLEDAGAQILLANTYHLLLRPGAEVFRRLGDTRRLVSWPKSVQIAAKRGVILDAESNMRTLERLTRAV